MHRASGRLDKAIETHTAELALAEEIAYPGGQAHALTEMGEISAERHDWHQAIALYERILAIICTIGNRRGEATCLWYLSSWLDLIGDRGQAITLAEHAFAIFTEIGDERAEQVQIELRQWKNEGWVRKKLREAYSRIGRRVKVHV
jgi:tetratricopeptide (TPR) repeat protein